jgi:uncharacterized membrane protein YczE
MSTIRRVAQLVLGLWLFGVSIALLVRANLGLAPWDVLHQGLSQRTGLSMGLVVIIASVVVLTLWIPLRQKPGLGTVGNVVLVGIALDATLGWLGPVEAWGWRALLLVLGVVVNAMATGLYISAGLGPGARDGLMTGLAAKGMSIRLARTIVEAIVLMAGWLLGGSVGIGTLVYALAIGPLAHVFIPLFDLDDRRTSRPAGPAAPEGASS